MTTTAIQFRHATDVETVWGTLIEIYAEVYAEKLGQAHYSVERYGERLARHASEHGWEVVIGYDGSEPVGYAYANTLLPRDRWWGRMTTPLPQSCAETSTVALKEGMLRQAWRGAGLARQGHDALLANRPEEQVTLLVNPLAGGGKVKALYEGWGYRAVGMQQPSADGPVLTAMLRAVREAAAAE